MRGRSAHQRATQDPDDAYRMHLLHEQLDSPKKTVDYWLRKAFECRNPLAWHKLLGSADDTVSRLLKMVDSNLGPVRSSTIKKTRTNTIVSIYHLFKSGDEANRLMGARMIEVVASLDPHRLSESIKFYYLGYRFLLLQLKQNAESNFKLAAGLSGGMVGIAEYADILLADEYRTMALRYHLFDLTKNIMSGGLKLVTEWSNHTSFTFAIRAMIKSKYKEQVLRIFDRCALSIDQYVVWSDMKLRLASDIQDIGAAFGVVDTFGTKRVYDTLRDIKVEIEIISFDGPLSRKLVNLVVGYLPWYAGLTLSPIEARLVDVMSRLTHCKCFK